MYTSKPSFIYGFHGLDRQIALQILIQQEDFKHSNNHYDWLGHGVYFWENNYERAVQYAIEASKRKKSTIKEPFVLGTIIDLGNCLDLLDQKYLDFLSVAYKDLKKSLEIENKTLPINSSFYENDFDFRNRELDCAVIRHAHQLAKDEGVHFDSVRAAFWEGEPLYEGAGFKKQNHIQIAVLNPNCIKGIFLPRDKVEYS
jgi:hypothetical protein